LPHTEKQQVMPEDTSMKHSYFCKCWLLHW
jgi:hypothetical protein